MATWADVEKRNKGIDATIPEHGSVHVERSARIDESVQKAQASRREALAKRPVINPSAGVIPALKDTA